MSILSYYIKLFYYYFFGCEYPEKKIYDSYFINNKIGEKTIKTKEKKKVIFMCDGLRSHGGYTDRMKGLLSTYILAKSKNYDFYIYWKSPFNLGDYLEPNNYEWRIERKDIVFSTSTCKPIVFDELSSQIKNKIKQYFFKRIISQKAHNLVYTNFIINKNHFAIAYKELFKPTLLLERNINYHLNKIGENYWSFSFRFGNLLDDFKDIVGFPLDKKGKEALIKKNKNELLSLLEYLPEGYKAFVTSDSYTFLSTIKDWNDKIYIIDEKIEHPEYFSALDEMIDPWLKLFLDQNLIMKAKKVFLLKTEDMYKSGFAEYAAFLGGKEYILHEF